MTSPVLPPIAATPSPAPTPGPQSSPPAGGEDAPFARELQQARQGHEAPKDTPPARPAAAGEHARTQREAAKGETTTQRDQRLARAVDASRLLADAEPAAATDGKGTEARTDDSALAGDASSLLAGLLGQAAARNETPASRGEARKGADAATAIDAAAGGEGRRPAGREAAADPLRGAADAASSALRATADAEPATKSRKTGSESDFAMQALTQAVPVASAPAPSAAPGADVRDAHVAAPLGSPEFAPAVGAQVSLLVREGVQEARLQLNPAEMGPVTVQIQIDGSSAQVTMSAEQAPTRQALEQALPALAGALRESGLTLTGGGVFEQSRQQNQGEPSSKGGRPGDRDDDGAIGSVAGAGGAAQRWAPRGVVDVYA